MPPNMAPAGGMPPSNAAYFHAAYIVAAIVYAAYALIVVRRRSRTRAALEQALARESGQS